MKTVAMMMKDLRLICRDRYGLIALLVVPIVVIMVVAAATQSGDGSKSILFPVVNADQGPVATALIRPFREHLDVRIVSRATAHHLVAEANDAPAALILPPELSKRYLAQKPSTVEMLTDPAQWRELEAIKVVMLLADRETAPLGDPFSQELLSVKEHNITGDNVSFSSLEQNIPGFSLMFVLLTLIFSVSLALREEEVWGTSARLSVAPVPPASLLGGKLLARLVVGTAQLLLLLLFGHFVYGLRLGHSPVAIVLVATAVVASMTCFAAVVAAFVRTREQAIPVGLAVAFVLASLGGLFWPLYDLPRLMQQIASALITTWSMSALQDVMLRDKSLVAVSAELLVLVVHGLVSFLIALRLFRYGGVAASIVSTTHPSSWSWHFRRWRAPAPNCTRRSYGASGASCCCSVRDRIPRPARTASARRSKSRKRSRRNRWSCARRRASRGCSRNKAIATRRARCSPRSTTGSPKASTPPT